MDLTLAYSVSNVEGDPSAAQRVSIAVDDDGNPVRYTDIFFEGNVRSSERMTEFQRVWDDAVFTLVADLRLVHTPERGDVNQEHWSEWNYDPDDAMA